EGGQRTLGSAQILRRIDSGNAWMPGGRLQVDRPDPGMSMRTADNGSDQHPLDRKVADITTLTSQQTGIFFAFDRRADIEVGHGNGPALRPMDRQRFLPDRDRAVSKLENPAEKTGSPALWSC